MELKKDVNSVCVSSTSETFKIGVYRNLSDGKHAIAFHTVEQPETGDRFVVYGSFIPEKILPIAQFLEEWQLLEYLEVLRVPSDLSILGEK